MQMMSADKASSTGETELSYRCSRRFQEIDNEDLASS